MSKNDKKSRNFFLATGTADMETLHSATIAWLLSDGCNAYTLEKRSEILHKIFRNQSNEVYDCIYSVTEFEHIDIILIAIKDKKINFYAIENKIKSSQHDNQLGKYDEILENLKKQVEDSHIAGRCLLSLAGEVPESENWTTLEYNKLTEILSSPDGCDDCHKKIANEYITTIDNIYYLFDKVLEKKDLLKLVFENGPIKKADKALARINSLINQNDNIDDDLDLITSLNLETFLQQRYFQKRIIPDIESFLKEKGMGTGCLKINETHGCANISITLSGKEGEKYWIESAIQKGSFKFAVSSFYRKKGIIDQERVELKKEYDKEGDLYNILNELKKTYKFKQINTSREQNYRISISNPFGKDIYYNSDFNDKFKDFLIISIKCRDKILDYIDKQTDGRKK